MAIPTLFVYGVMRDRLNRFEDVRNEISRYEGGSQTILGPVLLVPYEKNVQTTASDGKVQISVIRGEAVVFAETGTIDTTLTGEERRRAIYKIPVFRSDSTIKANFDPAESAKALAELDPNARYDWSKARLVMGVSNTVGILREIDLTLPGGEKRRLKPISATVSTGPSAANDYRPVDSGTFRLVAAPIGDLIGTTAFDVNANLLLSGAERFSVATFAKDTTAKISGKWPDPSFEGGFLPTTRNVTSSSFTAEWSAPLARRGIPEVGADLDVLRLTANQDFAVRLVAPTNMYTGVDRALKYAMMFIGLVFITYFMFEIVSGLRAHPAQYIMVGLGQAIFYLLLLAFAERVGFDMAFVIAAGATVALISLYVGVVFKKMVYTGSAFLVFTLLYALMYMLMQRENDALLVGAVTSFAALAALMYLTRKVDWYGLSGPAAPRAPAPAETPPVA
jgi:inner membrane protein